MSGASWFVVRRYSLFLWSQLTALFPPLLDPAPCSARFFLTPAHRSAHQTFRPAPLCFSLRSHALFMRFGPHPVGASSATRPGWWTSVPKLLSLVPNLYLPSDANAQMKHFSMSISSLTSRQRKKWPVRLINAMMSNTPTAIKPCHLAKFYCSTTFVCIFLNFLWASDWLIDFSFILGLAITISSASDVDKLHLCFSVWQIYF